jgi:hypothetical protein
MAPALLEQLRLLYALVDSDPTLSAAVNAHFKLLQSLVQQLIAHLEQQADQRTIEPPHIDVRAERR